MAARYLTAEVTATGLTPYYRDFKLYNDGYALFASRQVKLLHVEKRRAEVRVEQPRKLSWFTVTVAIDDDALQVRCNCPRGKMATCAHRAAALLALDQHLRIHPPCIWQHALAPAVKPSRAERRSAEGHAVIVFSLRLTDQEHGRVTAHSLSRRLLPAELPDDGPALARVIDALHLGDAVRPVYSRADFSTIANASPALIGVMGLMMANGYHTQESLIDTIIPLLGQCPAFVTRTDHPLGRPLTVSPHAAAIELATERTEDGVRLSLWAIADDTRVRITPASAGILGKKSRWLLHGDRLHPVTDAQALIETFLRFPAIEVPAEEMDEFLEEYLLPLAERVPLAGDFATAGDVHTEPEQRLYLREQRDGLCADLRFGYAGHELPYAAHLPAASLVRQDDGTVLRVLRRPEAEQEAWQALSGFGLKRGGEPGAFALRKSVSPIDFLLHQVPKLADAGYVIFGEEALTSARVNRHRPTLAFSVSSGIDWFDVQAVARFGEMEVSLKEIRRALHRRERYLKLADGTIGAIPEEWVTRYRRLLELGETAGEKLRLSTAQVTVLDELLHGADQARVDEATAARRRRLREFTAIGHREPPRAFAGALRQYQQAGYAWLHFLHDFGFGGCLADDMGTGKTIQALAMLQSLREDGHAQTADLVVVPRSLIVNWQREAARFAPDLRVLVHADGSRDQSLASFDDHDVVLTTYGVLLRDIEQLRRYTFHYLILDESQAIKNPESRTARAVRLLCGDHRLALTGTPVENNTVELWSQFAFLNPGLLGTLEFFRKEFAAPIERNGDAEAAQALRRLVHPFILRRTKEQVAPELPPRTERVLYCGMEPAQQRAYARMRDRYRAMLLGLIEDEGLDNARMKILEGLLRLRQLCNHPRLVDADFSGHSAKFAELLELMETLRAEGHKALVFSQFTRMLKLVRDELDARGIPYEYLDGRTQDRQARVDAFQQHAATPFFLISLKAGGVGLNLTAADYVIHIDPWWNPAVEMQASDRAHRIGQDKPVFIYKLIVQDSVEEKILLLQERKRGLVEQLIRTESGFFKSLTRADVAELFS